MYPRKSNWWKFKKGQTAWNVGKTKKDFPQMGNSGVKFGNIPWNKGKTGLQRMSLETRLKMKLSHKGKLYKRIDIRENALKKLRGYLKHSEEWRKWRQEIFMRDNYTCQDCGITSGYGKTIVLHPHHKVRLKVLIKNFLDYYSQFSLLEDLEVLLRIATTYQPFWDINNGETICDKCHYRKHPSQKEIQGVL